MVHGTCFQKNKDFGTKSTVVIQEDEDNHIYPLRIGSGNFSKAIKSKDFENPTVMEFIDINNFMSSYNDTLSRPNTSWNNLTVSHTASERVIEANSNEFSSIFSRLKQWCGEENHKTIIKDKKDYEFQLPNFLELAIDEKTINPIELYAYYIGLYINNMRNGVYLEYFLSFPVTYSLEVKEKIRLSFERGIKKSIPITILKDEELSKNIKVVQGCSEPAAYAVTALLEYDFQPELDDKIFYGVFDFGGGTTDFDFGIWREANFDDVNEERYDYIIEHFGSSGDRYLGGENILEHLAFEVFKNSANELLKSGIQFVKPIESNVFPGSEALLSNSQEANINSYKLMEALRPIWERHDGYDKEYSNGSLKVNLLDIKSKQHTQFELTLDLETVEKLIYNRIEQGVISFFEALKNVFHNNFSYNIDTINIFLAGNSSKSKVVKSLFKKYSDHISNDMDKKDVFKIFNPLGEDSSDHYKPNGKTGVAYGIIKTKAGGRIKVINHNTKNNNLDRFKYYIGKVRKDKLVPIITPDCEESWIRYFAATEREFEIFYTTNPKATTKKLEISESKKIRSSITKINSDASIYIKKTGTNKLNVVVAHEDGIENDIYLEEVGEFVLN
ncbi:MAG: hypothetical protein B6229_04505 [Spirochaetaceae bacterium 4572_7]|nr:MAG: hypothetical protein B6229_04505 [Spirochaetaceae bacterium 4572_7]